MTAGGGQSTTVDALLSIGHDISSPTGMYIWGRMERETIDFDGGVVGVARGKFEYWLTEDGLTLLKGYARRGLSEEQIANDKLHISRSTLSEWKKRFPDISDALKEGKDLPDIQVENALYEAAIGGNVTAMIFWLKNRLKGEWKDKPVEDMQTAALETAMRALADIIEKPAQNRNIEDFEE